jgi:hypothetical protein
MLHGAHSVGDTSEFTLIADANAQKIELKRGTRAWRIHEHREYVGEHWFHMNTTLARTLPLSLRALAHTPPETIDALEAGDTLEVPLDTGGHVVLRKLSHAVCKKKGFPFKDALAILAPNADGSLPPENDHRRRAYVVPTSLLELLHETKDPYFAAEQMIAALTAMACGVSRDKHPLEDRSALFFESPTSPKRMLFILCRGHEKTMRDRWLAVQGMLAQVYLRDEPLIQKHDRPLKKQVDVRALGPFKKEAAVAWRVSRHVLEDVDARSRRNTRAGKKKKGSSDRETSGPDKTPASKGATSIDPSIFQESATGITQQLALHVHRALNPGTQDLSLDVFVHVSGHAISRVRTPRPSRTEARATRSVDCAIKRGTFRARTRDARQVPLLRRSGRVQLIAYAPPLITAHT